LEGGVLSERKALGKGIWWREDIVAVGDTVRLSKMEEESRGLT
jgi:hypothetical protein